MALALEYEMSPVKASKARDIKKTAVKRAVKATDSIKTYSLVWLLAKRSGRFLWKNRVPLTVNAFLLENAYLLEHHFKFFFK